MKQIFKFIKLILKKFKHKEPIIEKEPINYIEIDELLELVELGDIIWAKRYNNDKDKQLIPEGHQEGPFIVLGKCDKGLITSQGSSVEPNENHIKNYFELNPEEYLLSKQTYFKLNQLVIIDGYSFIKKIDKLKDIDKSELFKKVKKERKNHYYLGDERIEFKMSLQAGDIINYNDINYLIMDIKDNEFICIPINKTSGQLKYNLKFDDFRNLDYSKIILINKEEKNQYITSVSNNSLLYVLKSYKEYIENCNNRNVTQRGSVIFKNNKYYYIYGEEGPDWLIFEIKKNKERELKEIKISNENFYTNYESEKINKKDIFDTILLASLSEMDIIKDQKRSYAKVQKNKVENKVPDVYNIGDIIEVNYYKGQRFIIIGKCKKTYECLSINKIKKAIYDPILIRKTDVRLSKNKSIKGIKWLEQHPEYDLKNISGDIIDEILKVQKEFINKERIDAPISTQRGSLIFKNNKYYYVYGEEGQDWLAFEVYKDLDINTAPEEIKISGKNFYTGYSNIMKISKKDSYKIISVAYNEEIEKIKNNKKRYNKMQKVSTEITNETKKIEFGSSIIKDGKEFIVVDVMNNLISCVSIYDLARKNYKVQYFNIDNIDCINSITLEDLEKTRKKLVATLPSGYYKSLIKK